MDPSDLTDSQWARLEPLVREPPEGCHAWGRTALVSVAEGDRGHVVCGEDRLSVASDAGRLPALADGVSAVSGLALVPNLVAGDQVLARTGPQGKRTQPDTHGGDHRFAVGQDGLKRGRWGYDARKKIKGRKRHIAVDTQGNVLAVVVHLAGGQVRVGARRVLMRLFRRFDTNIKVFDDGG